jgi:hypothetical protein
MHVTYNEAGVAFFVVVFVSFLKTGFPYAISEFFFHSVCG